MRRAFEAATLRSVFVAVLLGTTFGGVAAARAGITGAGIVLDASGAGNYGAIDVGDRYAVLERYVGGDVDVVAFDLTVPPPQPELLVAGSTIEEVAPAISGNRVAYQIATGGNYTLHWDEIPGLPVPGGVPLFPTWDYRVPEVWGRSCVYARDDNSDGVYEIYLTDFEDPIPPTLVYGHTTLDCYNPSIWRDVVVWQAQTTVGNTGVGYCWLPDPDMQQKYMLWPDLTGDRVLPSVWGEWIVWEDHTSPDYEIVAYNAVTHEVTKMGHDGAWDANPSVFDDRVAYTSLSTDLSSGRVFVHDLASGSEYTISEWNDVQAFGPTSSYGRYVGWWDIKPSSGMDAYVAQLDVTLDVEQLEGPNRYDTAVEISKAGWPDGSTDVLIATGVNFPDALGGAALAGAANCPILLTTPEALPEQTLTELKRLNPQRVYVLGGVGAVADAVQEAIEDALPTVTVTRLEGADRYGTARAVAEETYQRAPLNPMKMAFVATGANFPDALAVSPLAAALKAPIWLAEPGGIAQGTISEMQQCGVESVYMVGGADVVSDETERRLEGAFGTSNVHRLAGATRYETAQEIARFAVEEMPWMEYCGVTIATGENFPDALTGGVLAGRRGTVMLLTHSSALTPSAKAVLEGECAGTPKVTFFGGEGAISDDVVAAVSDAVQ